jgi:hypothetical protein
MPAPKPRSPVPAPWLLGLIGVLAILALLLVLAS